MAAIVLQVKVKPNARVSSLAQSTDGSWSAQLKARPVDGKANQELIALVARQFGCAKSAVSIKSGATGRLKLVLVSTPRKRGKDAGGYVYVDWGPEFAAHHNLAFPDRDNPATYVGLGPLGLQLVLKDGGSGYFRHHAVEPHLRAGRLELVRGAPEFLYPAYAVYSESPDDPKVVEPALAGLRSVAAALQPSARSRPRAKARK